MSNCLQAFSAQTYPHDRFELIVVDNSAAQTAKAVVEREQQSSQLRIRYVNELKSGAHNSYHAGVRVAENDILAFVDDDAEVIPDWLSLIALDLRRHLSGSRRRTDQRALEP